MGTSRSSYCEGKHIEIIKIRTPGLGVNLQEITPGTTVNVQHQLGRLELLSVEVASTAALLFSVPYLAFPRPPAAKHSVFRWLRAFADAIETPERLPS